MDADMQPQRLTVVKDEEVFAREALRTIAAVAKIEHTSLRNALLEEIVGLLRRVNNPQFIVLKDS